MPQSFDLSNLARTPVDEVRVLSLVEVVALLDPSVEVSSYLKPGDDEYNSIEWYDPADKARFTRTMLEEQQLQKTKENWIILLMEEANALQKAALSLHTISQHKPLYQKAMYDEKYKAAITYVGAVQQWQATEQTSALPTPEQVPVPDIIYEEGSRTGDPYYYLCLAIVQNYQDSESTLAKFYGQVEGERRLAKKRILACTTLQQLESVTWATWPNYTGNPPTPAD